jgi:hypothetical protein
MPTNLPHANDAQRQLAERDKGEGFDTQVAEFFGAIIDEEVIPTEIEEPRDFAKAARQRIQERATKGPVPIIR